MRKMATLRMIEALNPIQGADAIEAAMVDGWTAVVKKGEFMVGDLVVYCEIDSWIPTEIAPFLSKGKEPREFEGVKGERLRTIKLRGQLSQGLLLPATVLDPYAIRCFFNASGRWAIGIPDEETDGFSEHIFLGDDVSERLNIRKWEAPVNAQLAGMAKSTFPSFIPKTDQERCQNLVKEIVAANEASMRFEITEKLEGSSMTVYRHHGEFGVCSHNLDLKETEENAFWSTARADDIERKMIEVDEFWDFAIQGELIGPGIQGNIYGLAKPEFHVFDVYNIQTGKYLSPVDRQILVKRMGLKHVPVLHAEATLFGDLNVTDIPQLLKFADGKSVLGKNPNREGVVFKQVDGGMTFKAISNVYLLGEK